MRGYRIFAIGSNYEHEPMRYDKLFSSTPFPPLLPFILLAPIKKTPALLLNLRQNVRVLEQEVLLKKNNQQCISSHALKSEGKRRTSSPTLIELPPQPGSSTRSPALTDVGTTLPSLFGAPGPTAMTVASGRGLDVADVGRKIPFAVF